MDPGLIGLHDIVLAEPVSYAPATVGWLIVAVLLVVLLAGLVWWGVQGWRAEAYRRRALEELARLDPWLDDPEKRDAVLARLSPLVKRTALAFAPRERVASLSGDAWLRYLDEIGPRPAFVDGPGRRLEDIAFGSPEAVAKLPDGEARALFDAVRSWVGGHQRPRPTAEEA